MMEKARLKDHIEKGKPHYETFLEITKDFMHRWNQQYNKKLDQEFMNEFKRVINYHGWFYFDDLKYFLELGIMGELGEYKGMNIQILNSWFNAFQKRQRKRFAESGKYIQSKPTVLSKEARMENRRLTLQKHQQHIEYYNQNGQLPNDFKHYFILYAKLYVKCKYLNISDDEMRDLYKNYLHRISNNFIFNRKLNNEKNAFDLVLNIFKKIANGNLDFAATMKQIET